MNYFACDVRGTFDGCENDLKKRENEIKRLVSNLNKLIEIEDMDELFFSFHSSDSILEIKEYIKEFKKYIVGTRIKMGLQYGDNSFIDGNAKCIDSQEEKKLDRIFCNCKSMQILNSLKNNIPNKIFFADDSDFQQNFYKNFMRKHIDMNYSRINGQYDTILFSLNSVKANDDCEFCSPERGITGLNNVLENYINNLMLEKNIKIKRVL